MTTDLPDFTHTVRALVAENDRVPRQRVDSDAPYVWFDPEWVRVETTVFGVDGSVTRSTGWVRRDEWHRDWFVSAASERVDE